MNILCFMSLTRLEALTKASKPAANTGQNRTKEHEQMLNHQDLLPLQSILKTF
jgi:hypothetical protein